VQTSPDATSAVYFSEDSQHPADLWMLSGAGSTNHRLTDLNPQFEKQEMGKVRLVHWLSDDGEPLQGALLLPADYREGNRYPLLVFVYGGSRLSNNLNRFGLGYVGAFNMQLFATRGYAVLLPDSPQRLGTPMLDLVKTVLPGVNKVIEMGIADGGRLGVMGHSNGGYGTLGLIVQTTRFKAAVVLDGDGDLLSFYGQMGKDGTAYGTSIVEHGQNALGGTPWEMRDRFVENSPFFYLDRIETPLLLVHGSNDTAVAPFLADQIFVGLRRLGKEVKYARYEGEGHAPYYWRFTNQADFCQRMIEWFDSHLSRTRHP
jgi:dipeptidyl aminopeptidase/acylaminoacyl peptidase